MLQTTTRSNRSFRVGRVGGYLRGTVWYLQYRYGHGTSADGRTDVTYNEFRVGRGYLNVKFKPAKWFEA